MHAETGGGIHFADATADRPITFGDVGRQEIDTTNVKSDGTDRAHSHVTVVGMDDVGDIGGSATG